MAGVISGYVKIDTALQPSTWAAAVTSDYFDMSGYEKAIFIVEGGSMTASGTMTGSILQAYTSTGGGGTALGVYTTANGAPADATTVTDALAITIDNASSWTATNYVTLWTDSSADAVTYTFTSTSYTSDASTASFSTSRYVYSSSDMTHAAGAVEHLVAYINHATYGVPGITAKAYSGFSASSNDVYIYSDTKTINAIASASSAAYLYPNKWTMALECHAAELASASSFQYIAVQVTPSTVQHIAAALIRSGSRYAVTNEDSLSDYMHRTTN